MKSNEICKRAFSEIEIHTNGNVYTCCPDYLKKYPIGNIFYVSSFDEIWYSNRAKALRRSIINGEYNFCNRDICQINNDKYEFYTETPPYPTLVRFSYDRQCNLKCIFCRDRLIINTEEQNQKYSEMIDRIFIPVLKNATLMSITSVGEITASNHSQELLKRASETYPNLKFEILTNGLLFNEDFYNRLNLQNRIHRIVISLHAMRKKTYEKILRGSKYDIVFNNLNKIFKLKQEGKIKEVCLIFTTFSYNYKEIPEFIDFALKNDANPSVWEYRNHHKTIMDNHYKKYAVWEKTHPQYNDFVKIIKQVIEKYNNSCQFPEFWRNLEPISITEEYNNKIKSLFS